MKLSLRKEARFPCPSSLLLTADRFFFLFRWFVLGKDPLARSIVSIYDSLINKRPMRGTNKQTNKKVNLCHSYEKQGCNNRRALRLMFSFHSTLAQLREPWSEQNGSKTRGVVCRLCAYVFFLRQRRTRSSLPTILTRNHCTSLCALNFFFVAHTEPY